MEKLHFAPYGDVSDDPTLVTSDVIVTIPRLVDAINALIDENEALKARPVTPEPEAAPAPEPEVKEEVKEEPEAPKEPETRTLKAGVRPRAK